MGKIGTTEPIYIERASGESSVIRPGEDYFWVKIVSAQAVYKGSIWQNVKRLIIASKVALNDKRYNGKPVKAIQRYRQIKKNSTEKLGLSPNLVKIVPATMTHLSVSIDFILDKESNLAKLGGLINDDTFVSSISLAPGISSVAKTIGGISEKLLQTFVKAEEQDPILQFSGDFNLSKNDLQDGYYAILGTRDKAHPLPVIHSESGNALSVKDNELYLNGKLIHDLSYILLDVRGLQARTREQNEGASWYTLIKEAEIGAQGVSVNPFVTEDEKNSAWEKCVEILKKAQVLLANDPNYLFTEAKNIIRQSYTDCQEYIFGKESKTKEVTRGVQVSAPGIDLDFLNLSSREELSATLDQYNVDVSRTKEILFNQ